MARAVVAIWTAVSVLLVLTMGAARGNVVCVSDCSNVLDGRYQACHSCTQFVTCEEGRLRHRPCPDGLVWDDFQRTCLYTSSSCRGGANCVSDCLGLPDGFYPACEDDCSSFVECSTEMEYHSLTCPQGTVWDDFSKNCVETSQSCDEIFIDPVIISDTQQPDDNSCVSSCAGLQDGHYQSCSNCSEFVSCLSTRGLSSRSCTSPLQWDDNLKQCAEASSTCAAPVGCVDDCSDQPTGNYHSCHGCHVYVSCASGVLYDDRPCPSSLFWDDNVKQCRPSSSTCPGTPATTLPPTTIIIRGTTPTETEGPGPTGSTTFSTPLCNCVGSCYGVADGQYQSCLGCEYYVTCISGEMQDDIPCISGQVWDDILKSCMWESSTCHQECTTVTPQEASTLPEPSPCNCIESCTDVPDGHYQSCQGCEYYVTCMGDTIHDERLCSYGRVWDDTRKRCLWKSSTCVPECNTATPDGGGTNTATGYTTDRPPRYTTDRPTGHTTDRPTGHTTDRPTRYTTDRPTRYTTGRPPRYTTDRPTRYTTDRPTGGTTDRPTRYTTDRPPRYTTDRSTRYTTDRPTRYSTWRPWTRRTTTSGEVTPTGQHVCNCISSCHDLMNGHYQSCYGCEYFATCAGEVIWDRLLCTYGRVWDDHLKRCVRQSSTCYPGCDEVTPTPTTCECVESCDGLPDRLYQSCEGCESYVLCIGGEMFRTYQCPSGMIWDDHLKRCDHVSSTCHASCYEDGSESEEDEDCDCHEDSTEEEDSGGRTPGGHSKGKHSHEHSGGKSKKSKESGSKSKHKSRGKKKKGNRRHHRRRHHRSIEDIIDESKELYDGKHRGDQIHPIDEDEAIRSANREKYLREMDHLIAAAQNMEK